MCDNGLLGLLCLYDIINNIMDDTKKQYLLLLSEIIAKAAVIFGPEIALSKARDISGLVLDNKGSVTDIQGYIADTTKLLIDEYMLLSNQSIKNVVDLIFSKYPEVKKIS